MIQVHEDVNNKAVALTLKTAKLTAQVIAKAIAKALKEIEKNRLEGLTPQGKQTVKQLMNHYGDKNVIPLDGETRLFDKVAREWHVDYAFRKTGHNKYLLLFKAGDSDAITHCFAEYTKRMVDRAKDKRPSVLEQLKQFGEQVLSKPREHERVKEAVRDER